MERWPSVQVRGKHHSCPLGSMIWTSSCRDPSILSNPLSDFELDYGLYDYNPGPPQPPPTNDPPSPTYQTEFETGIGVNAPLTAGGFYSDYLDPQTDSQGCQSLGKTWLSYMILFQEAWDTQSKIRQHALKLIWRTQEKIPWKVEEQQRLLILRHFHMQFLRMSSSLSPAW